jgi:hypothetical protein
VVLALLTACSGGPESNSGPDAFRHEAVEVAIEKWITDDIDGSSGDTTDWMTFKIEATTAVVVTVVFEEDKVEAEVGLYDRYGMPVAEDSKRKSDNSRIILKGELPQGMNFVRVAAANTRERSNYTLQISAEQVESRPLRPF